MIAEATDVYVSTASHNDAPLVTRMTGMRDHFKIQPV